MDWLLLHKRYVLLLGFTVLILVFFFIGTFIIEPRHIVAIGDTPFSYREDLTSLKYVEKGLDSLNIRVIKLSEDEHKIVFEIVPTSTDDSSLGLVSPVYAMLLGKDDYGEKILAMERSLISLTDRNLIQLEGSINSANAVYIGCFLKKDLFQYKDNGVPIPFFLEKIPLSQYEKK